MSRAFASGNDAIAECDICGFRYKLKQLRELVVNEVTTNIKACPECWNEDHPQLLLGKYPIDDPQAIRDPRPDFAGYEQSRKLIVPAVGQQMTASVGQVTIST
jgi:hypothetical protein